jgi:general secretion pathway protein F
VKQPAYSALDIAAATAEDAIRQAESQGYRVIESRRIRSHPFSFLSRTHRFSVSLFSQELLTLLDAGLNIVEALCTLLRKQRNDSTRAVLQALMQQLKQGRSFSQALEALQLIGSCGKPRPGHDLYA